MTRKVHQSYTYTAKSGCLVSKHFASAETAQAWFERVGAQDVTHRGEIVWNAERKYWEAA